MTTQTTWIAALVLIGISAAQSTGPVFEVASVKLLVPGPPPAGEAGGRGSGDGCAPFKMDRGRVDICAGLTTIIGYAYRIPPSRIVGPAWMAGRTAPRFVIAAKLPEGSPATQVPEMLQALLAERFKLAARRGTREEPVYALVVAKTGLKVKVATSDASATEADSGIMADTRVPNADGKGFTITKNNSRVGTVRETDDGDGRHRWEAPNTTFAGLADLLTGVGLLSDVVDMTGSPGRYAVDLQVSMREAFAVAEARRTAGADPVASQDLQADMQSALLKGLNDGLLKLGLQLELRKGSVETFIVDHAEKTPTGN